MKDVLSGLKVDKDRAQKIVTLMLRDKTLVKISDELGVSPERAGGFEAESFRAEGVDPKIDVARFKDLTGVSPEVCDSSAGISGS